MAEIDQFRSFSPTSRADLRPREISLVSNCTPETMNSKRLNRRLLLVIALFGIFSAHVISAQEDVVTTDATTEEGTPATDDQTANQDSTAETRVETATSGAQDTVGGSDGETATSAGTGGTGDGGTETTAAGASVTLGTGVEGTDGTTAEESNLGGPGVVGTATSTGELIITGTGSDPVQTGDDTTGTPLVEASTGRTEGETTATLTGEPSTGGTGTGASVRAIIPKDTTGTAATEDTTASVKQTVEYTTSVRHASTEGQTETIIVTGKETEASSIPTVAPSAGSTDGSQTLDPMKINNSTTINGSLSEEKGNSKGKRSPEGSKYKYKATVDITDENKPSESIRASWIYGRNTKYILNSSAVATLLKKKLTKTLRIRRETLEVIDIAVPGTVTVDQVAKALNETFHELITDPKSPLQQPSSETASKPTGSEKLGIWEAHYGLFLTILILISVCVVVTAVCGLCMLWRGRGRETHSDKKPIRRSKDMEEAREAPTAVSNPIPDAEMIQDEAPMQERENPAVTPNGGGQHISKADEDNGWVVPLDELSKAEKEKPEVENTRL